MPPLNTMLNEGLAVRTLLYGADHTRKTTWAGRAAEAGFHVVFLDCDDKPHVLHQLSPEAKSRIHVVSIKDLHDRACAQEFMAAFFGEANFAWNEQDKRPIYHDSQLDLGKSYYIINALKLNKNIVLVMDSWTRLIRSVQFAYCLEKKIDMLIPEKMSNLRDFFGACGQVGDKLLDVINVYDCHVIVIGHSTVYEKRKPVPKGKQDLGEIEWTRTQLISTSGPKAFGLGTKFADILYFTMPAKGTYQIDTGGDQDRMGGCTMIPPATYNWSDLQFDYYVKHKLIAPPDIEDQCEAFQFYPANSITDSKSLGLGPGKLQLSNAPLVAAADGKVAIPVRKGKLNIVTSGG